MNCCPHDICYCRGSAFGSTNIFRVSLNFPGNTASEHNKRAVLTALVISKGNAEDICHRIYFSMTLTKTWLFGQRTSIFSHLQHGKYRLYGFKAPQRICKKRPGAVSFTWEINISSSNAKSRNVSSNPRSNKICTFVTFARSRSYGPLNSVGYITA